LIDQTINQSIQSIIVQSFFFFLRRWVLFLSRVIRVNFEIVWFSSVVAIQYYSDLIVIIFCWIVAQNCPNDQDPAGAVNLLQLRRAILRPVAVHHSGSAQSLQMLRIGHRC